MHTPHLRRFFGVAELATARKFQIGNLKFQIEATAEQRRRAEALRSSGQASGAKGRVKRDRKSGVGTEETWLLEARVGLGIWRGR